jgi:hypothetical protein
MADKLCPMTGLNGTCREKDCAWYDTEAEGCTIPLIRNDLSQLNALVSRIEENSK